MALSTNTEHGNSSPSEYYLLAEAEMQNLGSKPQPALVGHDRTVVTVC